VRSLSHCYLYGILDLAYAEISQVSETAEAMIRGGVDLIQLRGKKASIDELTRLAEQLHPITSSGSVPLVVNDHPEIACRVPVEGIHVGQDDLPVAAVREKVGRRVLVGKSTHSFEQAAAAEDEQPDYVGFGPLFATPTKPNYQPIGLEDVQRVHDKLSIPIFCIGGIKLHNLAQVIAAGAQRVVIVSGLLQADDIQQYAAACKKLLAPRHSAPI
jgi:thiamine-phosphate pyrophosphorylase